MNIKIKQSVGIGTPSRVDTLENLVILLPAQSRQQPWSQLPYGDTLKRRLKQCPAPGDDTPYTTELPNPVGTAVSLVLLGSTASSFERLTLARKLVAPLISSNPKALHVLCAGLDQQTASQGVQAVVAATLAASYPMPGFKRKAPPARRLKTIHVYGIEQRVDFSRVVAQAEGNNLVRHLATLPANHLTPRHYLREATRLAREQGWQLQFYDAKQLHRLKAGAFLAVAQGSPRADAGIVHLRYTPTGKRARQQRPLALVGKGICFDTGGTNLKPAKFMHGMHQDMAGSAVALGTLLALTQLKVAFPVDCWLALAENHIGPNAYRQNEVVTALNGTTIEVIHTDAEGRMVLADTLALASRHKPALMLDYATLTGTCISALSSRYAGAFTNREAFIDPIIAAGKNSGERVWPFPLDADFDQELESEVADIKQCTLDSEADHILASRFLSRFVADDIPWVHLDLAASSHKGGLAHIPTTTTGFGVGFSLELILSGGLL